MLKSGLKSGLKSHCLASSGLQLNLVDWKGNVEKLSRPSG